MKTIVIYTNCQGRFIFHYLKGYFQEHHRIFIENYEYIYSKLELPIIPIMLCDIFIYQPVDNQHGKYSTSSIVKLLKESCISIGFPSLYSDIYPLYNEGNFFVGIECIINYKKEGKTLADLLEMYDNNTFDFLLDKRFESSMKHLIMNETKCNIKVSNFIYKYYKKYNLFHSQNHPSGILISFISIEIMKLLGILYDIDVFSQNIIFGSTFPHSRYQKVELDLQYNIGDSNDYYREKIIQVYNADRTVLKIKNPELIL